MAVRKFFLTFGQSNGGTIAPANEGTIPVPVVPTDWENLHAGIAIAAGSSSPTYTQGGYNDLFVMPGTFPNHQVVDLKAKAVRGIRYLTPYNPTCTGAGNPQLAGSVEFYTSYPGTGRILAGSTTTALFVDRIWQHDPTGQTITREATGTTHTITGWGVNYPNPFAPPPTLGPTWANAVTVSPAFDPAPVTGEQVTFQHVAGENSGSGNNAIVCLSMRYGYDWDGAGAGGWKGGLDGLQLSCTAGTAANLVGTTGARTIKRIYLGARTNPTTGAPIVEIELTTPFPQPAVAGDVFSIAPAPIASTAVSFRKWAFFLPWSPHEGESSGNPAGTKNPFPPGFNYPNHHDTPSIYQPFSGSTLMYGGAGQPVSRRCAYHVGLANRFQEALGEEIYVVSLAVNGTSIAHNELSASTAQAVGWHDPRQQTSWAPGEANGCYQRLLDVLDSAVLAATAQGDTLECVGVFFIQGEGDSVYLPWAERYRKGLIGLKRAVRQAIKDRNLFAGAASAIPWIQPKIREAAPWTYASTINAAIAAEAADDDYMRTVEVSDLTTIPTESPSVHYTGLGLTLLEQRVFAAWELATAGTPETAATPAATPGSGGAAEILAVIDQAIASGGDVAAYTINGRTVQLRSMQELIAARKYFQAELARANGLRRTKIAFR